jgi:N-acetylmuramidase
MPLPLTEDDYQRAAQKLGCEVAAVKAVAEVESGPHGAFLSSGDPVILFERHKFHQFTGGKYDQTHPGISNKTPGGYGAVSQQHTRLQEAAALDPDAALMSCSWGRFQVMGFHWKNLDYPSLKDFVDGMYLSEANHLDSFVRYIEKTGLAKHLKTRNWAGLALGYNGQNYKINKYDEKLAAAYKKHRGTG